MFGYFILLIFCCYLNLFIKIYNYNIGCMLDILLCYIEVNIVFDILLVDFIICIN